jgi:starch phosphorylase
MGGETSINPHTKTAEWHHEDTIQAMAYDIPITGFNTFNTNNLRLWRSKPYFANDEGSDNADDNCEDLVDRIDKIQDGEYLTSIYYPNIPG